MSAEPSKILTWLVDTDDRIEWGNAEMRALLRTENPEDLQQAFTDALSAQGQTAYFDAFRYCATRYEAFSAEIELFLPDDRRLWLAAAHAPRFDEGGTWTGYIVSAMDITAQKEFSEKAWIAANYDKLTGLANRSLFEDLLQRQIISLSRARQLFAVLFADLDGFKAVNDTHGHAAGDAALREVARRWLGAVRRTDTVARLGGDEFGILLTNVKNIQQAEYVAAELIVSLSGGVDVGNDTVCELGASIGIVLPQDAHETVESLFARADTLMYESKKAGKNRFRSSAPSGAGSLLLTD